MYGLGARKLGATSLPPLGCLPLAITLFGFHDNGCVSRINTDAQAFNKKINSAATSLKKQLPGLKIVIFDIYKPLYDLIRSPSKFGKQHAFFNWLPIRKPASEELKLGLLLSVLIVIIFHSFFLFCRFCWSKERLLWYRDLRDNIIFVQSKVNRDLF